MEIDFNSSGALFCNYLVKRITACGSGASEDGEYISPDRPRDRFFIGRLSPVGVVNVAEEILESSEDFLTRLNPCSMRMRFLLRGTLNTTISVCSSFHVYIRVFPDYERQLEDAELVFARTDKAELMPAFYRVQPKIKPIELSLADLIKGYNEIEVSWDRSAFDLVPFTYKGKPPHFVTKTDLSSEDSYKQFLKGISGNPIIPDIRVTIIASAESVGNDQDLWEISLALVNRSVDTDPSGKDRLSDEVIFNIFFQPWIF